MENNLNYKGIDGYSKNLSKEICNLFFSDRQVIVGSEILELVEIRQINLFVIKNLFTSWQREAENLKSPYFNYEKKEVKEAHTHFMNILSKNIAVDRAHFEPLLYSATKETLFLIFSPYDFYMHQIADKNANISAKDLKSIAKYVKINQNILNALIEKMSTDNTEADKDRLKHLLNEVFAHTDATPEDVDPYFDQFNQILPLSENDIYGDNQTPKPTKETESTSNEEQNEKSAINEQFETSRKILNDELKGDKPSTLADVHQKQKIQSIEKHLSINQRFMFINSLFGGDEETFRATIGDLEQMENKKKASDYLISNYPDWDHDSEEVEEFMEVIEKRFD